MSNYDAICDLMSENGNMKRLLAEILPDMESRLEVLNKILPGREVLTAVHRHERFIREINEFIKDFEVK